MGTDIDQTPEGLTVYTKTQEERVPEALSYAMRIQTAVADAAGDHSYCISTPH